MGWFKQPARHALAAKGIPTSRFQSAQLRKVQGGNRVGGTFGKGFSYDHQVKSLGRKYVEGEEIGCDDYERAVAPVFDTLAEADILADKGDFKNAVAKLELAARQYTSLAQHFNVVRDEDSREYLTVTRLIADKTISRSRAGVAAGAVPQNKVAENPGVDHDSQ
jgi:hypothetical protein